MLHLQGLRIGDVILSVNGRAATSRQLAIEVLDASQSFADVEYLPGNGKVRPMTGSASSCC